MSSSYMNKKNFAASIGMTKSTFERRSIQIDCKLPRGLLNEEYRKEWLDKLHKWERLQLEKKRQYRNDAK
jgi:hypothetical protein